MLDQADIQGLLFFGYGHMPHSRFVLLTVENAAVARQWIADRIPAVTTGGRMPAGAPKPPGALNIAITHAGLAALGLPAETLGLFPREFRQGAGSAERARVLGDLGSSAPESWEFGGPANRPAHILLLLYASSQAHLEELSAKHLPADAAIGLTEVFRQDSFKHGAAEPFGFSDGISQPAIEGDPSRVDPGQDVLKPGEFLLGHTNEYENITPAPCVPLASDPQSHLPADPGGGVLRSFGFNGAYLIFRKLQQDVTGFWSFMEAKTRNADGSVNEAEKVRLAAKMIGRWPSGAPLTLCPTADDPALGADRNRNNVFGFSSTDANGYGCPIGSHVRRTNPRDALQPNSPAHSRTISNRHRILRRGRPYSSPAGDPAAEQGLFFMALNGDIQRQFEFIQQTWLNNGKFQGLYDNNDPIVSTYDGEGVMVIQRDPVRSRITDIPRFVQTRGTAYLLLPSIRALRYLASLPNS